MITSMPETTEHRIIRSKAKCPLRLFAADQTCMESQHSKSTNTNLLPEFEYIPRPAKHLKYEPCSIPSFLSSYQSKIQSSSRTY